MKFISLFSGIEGMGYGLEQAGMECVAQVEINKYCNLVLERHYPHVLRIKDVKEANKNTLPAARLVCGGSPCQDVSVAGERKGLAGERSGLFFEFVRVLKETQAEWFVFENVEGLLSSNKGKDFAVVLNSLVECGYRLAYRVFDSQHFGVPQRRARVFIVGHLGDGRAASVLFESESVQGRPTPAQKTRDENPRPLTRTVGEGCTEFPFGVERPLVGTLAASGAGTMRPAGQRNEKDFLIPFRKVSSREFVQSSGVSSTLMARDYKDFGDLVVQQGVRRLTPLECERLQGFEDEWTAFDKNGKPISDKQRYHMLGNAVTTTVLRWIGERIMEAEHGLVSKNL